MWGTQIWGVFLFSFGSDNRGSTGANCDAIREEWLIEGAGYPV